MEENMQATEARRLYQWLIEHGHTEEEANEAIAYVIGAKERGSQTIAK